MESLHNQLIKRQIREMQIKTVESLSHSSQNSCHRESRGRGGEEVGRNLYILLVRIQNCCTSGNQYGSSFFKKKLQVELYYTAIPFLSMLKINELSIWQEYLYFHVSRSIVPSSQ